MATTVTAAKTFARIALLKIQLRTVLRRTTDISEGTLNRLMSGVDKRLICGFSIYALDGKGLCRAELDLDIDWSEHDVQLAIGKATIAIDETKWQNDTAIEIDEAVNAFKEFVAQERLRTELRTPLIPEVRNDAERYKQALDELGLVLADPVKWAGTKAGVELGIDELPELRVGLFLCEE